MLMMPLLGMGGGGLGRIEFVADFGMGLNYSGTQAGLPTSVTLTVNPDGTWAITFGGGDTPAGSPTSGTWALIPQTGAGNDIEVLFTKTNEVGGPTGANDAATYTRLTAPLSVTVSKAGANASADVAVDMRHY